MHGDDIGGGLRCPCPGFSFTAVGSYVPLGDSWKAAVAPSCVRGEGGWERTTFDARQTAIEAGGRRNGSGSICVTSCTVELPIPT